MLDAVDRVVKLHISNLLNVGDTPIFVYSLATADADDQTYSQAGEAQKPDTIEFPFASLTRTSNIDITDSNMTKVVHTYTGFKLNDMETRLTYYRCTLHYTVTIFAESRKVAEDLATALYGRLRHYCQVTVAIQLPIELSDNTYAAAEMQSDIVLGPTIEQVSPITLDKAQVYKTRISFDLQNVNIYHTNTDTQYKYNIYVQAISEAPDAPKGQKELIFEQREENNTV